MLILLLLMLIFLGLSGFGQSRSTENWIDYGRDHINKWLQIAPGALGPNALPVPFMDYALVDSVSSIEAGVHGHYMKGDKSINSYLCVYWAIVPKRVALHVWGFPSETFRTNNSVRDERQIYYDDTGFITQPGDYWLSTIIQILRERKNIPSIAINYSSKTTLGGATQGRFTDAPANYYYMAFGKSFFPKKGIIDEVRLGFLGGFYVWQTNKVEMAQDEGSLFEFGIDLKHDDLSWRNEIGGYHGYDAYQYIMKKGKNDPVIFRTNFKQTGKKFDWKLEYQTGFRDYQYQTIRFSVFYKFGFGLINNG